MRFPLNKNYSLERLLEKTYHMQFIQLKKVVKAIFSKKTIDYLIKLSINEKWSKKFSTKKMLDIFYKINITIDKKKYKNKIRATFLPNSQFKPYIILHGDKYKISN